MQPATRGLLRYKLTASLNHLALDATRNILKRIVNSVKSLNHLALDATRNENATLASFVRSLNHLALDATRNAGIGVCPIR